MSRRRRFIGHRNHMGHFITGMNNMPPPGVADDDDNAASAVNMRKSPSSQPATVGRIPASDIPLSSDYPFGRGGVYEIPIPRHRNIKGGS